MPNTKHIDLLQIIREGTIGPLRLGDTRTMVLDEFGEPTNIGYESTVLLYGTVEFHLLDDKLFGFHCNYPCDWDSGDLVTLDPWTLAFGKPLAEVAAASRDAGLSFELVKHPIFIGQIHILFESGVMLSFDLEEPDANGEPTLFHFGLSSFTYFADNCRPI